MVTADIVIKVITALVTFAFAELSKKYNWVESKYIPYQNFFIGVITGCLLFALQINTNLIASIISCLFASFCAGGVYDAIKTKKRR